MFCIIFNYLIAKLPNYKFLILLGAALLSFTIYSIPLASFTIFNSPDENANFVFAEYFARTGDLRIPLTQSEGFVGQEFITPRSVISHNGFFIPGGFIGLPLIYGFLAKFFSPITQLPNYPITFFTPFFAILGVLAFFGIIRRILNDRVAFISALLLFIHPALWYWASRIMMNNVLFVSLVLIGLYFLIRVIFHIEQVSEIRNSKFEIRNKFKFSNFKTFIIHIFGIVSIFDIRYSNFFLSGLFFGLALLVRTFDMIWLAPVIIVMFLWATRMTQINTLRAVRIRCARRMTRMINIATFLTPLLVSAAVLLYWNALLYGSPFSFGYQPPAVSLASEAPSVSPLSSYHLIISYLFPFGFHPRAIVRNFWNYGLGLFWWWSILALLGLVFFLKPLCKIISNRYYTCHAIISSTRSSPAITGIIPVRHVFLYFYISIFLIFIYGSGRFIDHPDPQVISLGNSYTRYWLLLHVLSLPLVAFGVEKIFGWVHRARDFTNGLVLLRPTNAANIIRVIRGALPIRVIPYLFLYFSIFLFLGWNSYYVLAATDVSLLSIRATLKSYAPKVEKVLALTELDSLIIAGPYDKIFWPQRQVAYSLNNAGFLNKLPQIAGKIPVYYYAWERDQKTLERDRTLLARYGLRFSDMGEIAEAEKLYRIETIEVGLLQ